MKRFCSGRGIADGESEPELERVVASFRLVEPVLRELFVEPSEWAFRVMVPRGWRVSETVDRSRSPHGGGIPVWRIEDPATGSRVFNDGQTIPFQLPAAMPGFFGGFGGMPMMGGGPAWNVQPFQPADQLARGVLSMLALAPTSPTPEGIWFTTTAPIPTSSATGRRPPDVPQPILGTTV